MSAEHYSSPVLAGEPENYTVERQTARQATRTPEGTTTVLARSETPPILTEVVHFDSSEAMEFFDFTEVVRESVGRSGVKHGQVTLHTPHTTTTLVLNESETGFINDFRRLMDQTIPADVYYEHDDHAVRTENLQEDEFINGHSHCRQMIVGSSSVTVPIVGGEIVIGQWQRVLLVELDQARPRRLMIHSQGV